jgi:hypothetical protein
MRDEYLIQMSLLSGLRKWLQLQIIGSLLTAYI